MVDSSSIIYVYIYTLAKTRQYPLTVIQQGSERKVNRSGKIDQEIRSRILNKKLDPQILIGRLDHDIQQHRAKWCIVVQCRVMLRNIVQSCAVPCSILQRRARSCMQYCTAVRNFLQNSTNVCNTVLVYKIAM